MPRWAAPVTRLLWAACWVAGLGDGVLFWVWLLNNVAITHQLALWRAGVGP